jgi:translocation and assembly module TamA
MTRASRPGGAARRTTRALALLALLAASLPTVSAAAAGAAPRLVLQGVGDADAAAVQALFAQAAPGCQDGVTSIAPLSQAIDAELRRRARVAGHYAPVIARRFEPSAGCWTLLVRVDAGAPARVHNAVFSLAGGGADFTDIVARQPRPGQAFVEAEYERFKAELAARASALGYFDATFTHHAVDIWPRAAAVDIHLAFTTGPRYRFGETRFEPDSLPLAPPFLATMAPFQPGQPYDADAVAELRRRLVASGHFDSIDVSPALDELAAGSVPVVARLRPLPRRETAVGAGFATDIGPRLRASYLDRFIGSRGRQLDAQVAWSPVVAEATVSLKVPSERPASSFRAFDAGFRHEETDDTSGDSVSVGGRQFTQWPSGWRRTLFVDVAWESFRLGDTSGQSLLVVPGVRAEHLRSDTGGRFERGHRLLAEVRATHTALLSGASFAQARIEAAGSIALGARARAVGRVAFGGTWVDGFSDLPPSYRFFAGGDQSVRGYDYRALGPRDAAGSVVGGRHMAVASVELERAVSERWSLAAFVDAGNAFDSGLPGLRAGAGAGVRYRTPIGSLRVDLAQPVDGRGSGLRVHVGIGSLL